MNRRPNRVAGRLSPPKKPEPRRTAAARWRALGKGPKWFIATLAPLLLAAAVPGIAPWVVDKGRDLYGEQPVTVSSENFREVVAGLYWATGDQVTVAASENSFDAVQRNGAQMGISGHEITLDSNRSGRIDLVRIAAVVEKRLPPLAGTAFIADPQGSSDAPLIDFHLDSGTEVPALVPDESGDPGKAARPYLSDGKVLFLEKGQTEHLIVRASTRKCFCTWRVRIEYTYRGDRRTVTLPPPESPPFKTTAWGFHRIEYNLNPADGGSPARYDCVAQPAACRVAPR